MDAQTNVATGERRTRGEIRQIITEFASSGMQPVEFCRTRGISRSTLARHLRKQRAQNQVTSTGNPLLAVEVRPGGGSWPAHSSGLVIGLRSGRKIEVSRGFDAATLERLLNILEGM